MFVQIRVIKTMDGMWIWLISYNIFMKKKITLIISRNLVLTNFNFKLHRYLFNYTLLSFIKNVMNVENHCSKNYYYYNNDVLVIDIIALIKKKRNIS